MGCPMCNWKTAVLLVVGVLVMLMAPGYWSLAGIGLVVVAYVWALWPKKSCTIDPKGRKECRRAPAQKD